MAGGGRRRRIRLSKLYSFACGKQSLNDVPNENIGTPGFSRVVYCNEPDSEEAMALNYIGNYVKTTKFTLANFVPKSLFEQFRRVANFYFLIIGIVSFTPLAPYAAVSAIVPLVVIISATMIKEGLEDLRRQKQDFEVNSRKVLVHRGGGTFEQTEWKNLRVGDVVKVEKDSFFPADLFLLSSTFEDGVCYVETMNLDGETNLKLKQALEVTLPLQEDHHFRDFRAVIKCEDPNANLYAFVGTVELNGQPHSLSPQQLLLRDSKLRNTDYVYGAVVFTGQDSKVVQNSTDAPSKRSQIERRMDKIIYVLFGLLFFMAGVGSIYFGVTTKEDLDHGEMKRWYLRPDDSIVFYDPNKSAAAAFCHFLTALMLYSYFIPISLYVSVEIVKVLQSSFINKDIHMYHEETDKPAHARTSNLNEELGQVDTVLSDKTGTLTCNSMEFIKCTIAGVAYGRGVTEVERAMARRKGSPLVEDEDWDNSQGADTKLAVKGFNFKDERMMNGNWVNERRPDIIQKFLQLLAVCHTAIPEVDEATDMVTYEAESPDEASFVVAARELGFEFYTRTQTSITVHELDPMSGRKVEREYTLLNVIEFNSARKRMSVIVRDEDGKILLLSKGADSVMFERLAKNNTEFVEQTREHVNEYADTGLRTLILGHRVLEEEEYNEFDRKLKEAKNSVSAERDAMIEAVVEKMERDLILLGATAVEDKLQKGVPECIDKLAQAGIKIWVLTGDKMETAINIGFACSLLRQDMKQFVITLDAPDIVALEKTTGDKAVVAKASKERILHMINKAKAEVVASRGGSEAFALIIDGKSLTYALEDDVKGLFLDLAIGCASVICCRSSPKQKALVTKLVKTGTGKTTLGIGDGANDVGMLQEADIGIGISGVEGMQAVMSSDVAIAQFRYLERLLLVHGHWCYRRISSMICYFFYKNMTFGFTIFLYEAFTSFSGQPLYNDWFMALYNMLFTSIPVLALGILDQDVPAKLCIKFPLLYQEGVQNVLFAWKRILGWMFNGLVAAIIIFSFCVKSFEHQAFNDDGRTVGRDVLGATMYTCVVWAVNCQLAIFLTYFTRIHHIVIWGSILLWYIFMLIYGSMNPDKSQNAYKIFTEALAPAASFWFLNFCAVVTSLIPYFAYNAIQTQFFPMYHNMLQYISASGQADDPEFVNVVRQGSLRPTTVGFTARIAAKANRLKQKITNRNR